MEQDSARLIREAFLAASRGTLVERMGITVHEGSAERVTGTMPVAGNTQPYGLLHGGASCVLAETLGSLGAALHAGMDRVTMGIEISATHHRAATSGYVTGVASRLHGGRTVASYEVVISDEQGRRVCTARLTCLLSDRVPGRDGRAPGHVAAAVAAMRGTADTAGTAPDARTAPTPAAGTAGTAPPDVPGSAAPGSAAPDQGGGATGGQGMS